MNNAENTIRLCPDCGKEMETGYLEIDRFATFNKERRTLLNGLLLEEHDIVLTGDGILSNHGGSFHAWVCRDCGLMLFGYENNRAGKGKHPLEVIADKVDNLFEKIDDLTDK